VEANQHIPWITLERIDNWHRAPTLHFEMKHSKTLNRQTFQLEWRNIYTLSDAWTWKYIVRELTTVLAALTRNTVEAGVSSIDVYREDYSV